MEDREVELRTAFYWRCEDCGFDNFDLPHKLDLDEGQLEDAYRDMNDIEDFQELPADWRNFEVCQIPAKVTCEQCGSTFLAVDDTNEIDDL